MARIDLNDADAAALDAIDGLRGHGPEIVRFRGERGGFTRIAQLDEVPGLTGKLPDDLEQWLTIGHEPND